MRITEGQQACALRPLEKSGGSRTAFNPVSRGVIVIARVDNGRGRHRAAVDRHRAIVVAAREASRRLGYRTKRFVLTGDDFSQFAGIARQQSYQGMLILSGLDGDVLRHFFTSSLPCVYADVAGEDMAVHAVAPDYRQSISLAMGQLLAAGFQKPGLVLDRDLSLLAREHLIDAYGFGLSIAGLPAPPPFLTPTRPFDLFEAWLRRHAFDSLLTTDFECTRRLASENKHPILGLNMNLQAVGHRAVEMLHEQIGIRHDARA